MSEDIAAGGVAPVTLTTPPPPPADAAAATARRDELIKDPEFRKRFFDGNAEARAEMSAINQIIAGQVKEQTSLEGQLSADYARDRGVSEEVIQHHLVNRTPISAEEHAAAVRWRNQHFEDGAWRELFMKGDVTARREAALSSILISSPVKPAA